MPSTASLELHDRVSTAGSATAFGVDPSRRFNRVEDRQYLLMRQAYGRTGGLLSGTDAAHRLRRHCAQPLSTLARWIVTRRIVSFEWRSQILVPMFQFDPGDMTVHPCVVDVMREFEGVFDDWECAVWFAEPNAWLEGMAPLDALSTSASRVVEAARADRFIARG